MGSNAMMYTPGFINTGSGIRTLVKGIHRQHSDVLSFLLHFFLFFFYFFFLFFNNESKLTM
jgi:hypothetical protein